MVAGLANNNNHHKSGDGNMTIAPGPTDSFSSASLDTDDHKLADTVSSSSAALTQAQKDGVLVDNFSKRNLQTLDEHIDKELSAKLFQMSVEERTKGIHELHGVYDDDSFRETPELLLTKLSEVTQVANSILSSSAAAYRRAFSRDTGYVERMKLLCLRADHYDSTKAAHRLLRLFEFKQELFGDNKLTSEITLQDFQGEELEALREGAVQLLQERDRAGRAVLLFVVKTSADYSVEAGLKVLYYTCMMALRDDEIQKRGMVLVGYLLGSTKFHSDRPGTLARALNKFPARFVAMHVCHDIAIMELALKLFSRNIIETQTLCRVRGHYGSHLEIVYNLMTFGIPHEAWPMLVEGTDCELDLSRHHEWLETLRVREEQESNLSQQHQQQTIVKQIEDDTATGHCSVVSVESLSNSFQDDNQIVAVPGPMDIVMGRGRHKKTSVGYLKFRNVLDSRLEEYEAVSKTEKRDIVDDLFQQLTEEIGIRFVRSTPAGYVKEYNEVAREKVSHTFRNLRLQQKAKKNPTKKDKAKKTTTTTTKDEATTTATGGKSSSKSGNKRIGGWEVGNSKRSFSPHESPWIY